MTVIRSEQPSDVDAIRRLIDLAFADAAHRSGTEAAIVDALRSAGVLTLSLVAEADGAIVGHAAFSPVAISATLGRWFGLGPVAVLPPRQRQGIGQALIRSGLERLRQSGAGGCVLLGDPAYYRRFGFVGDPALRFGDVPPPYFQQLSFTGARALGVATFHPAFDAAAPRQ